MVRAGDVEAEILAAADHSDVLVLGAHGLNPTRDLLLGTTAERMLRKSRRPMIVVRKEPRAAYQRVFVAVDFSMHSMAALAFAVRIAPSAHLHVFHAFECPYESKLRRADIAEEILRQLQSRCRDQAFANVRNMIEKSEAPVERVSSVVVSGNPRHVTHAAAAEWGADLIVLGKHGHSAIGEFFLGGVTRHTLSRAESDVAVIPHYPRL
ncbi:MAG: universal stress protein [Proteobacteria bacterium]|nr:universal stress protein [Pseudomonadota bacterium]